MQTHTHTRTYIQTHSHILKHKETHTQTSILRHTNTLMHTHTDTQQHKGEVRAKLECMPGESLR